MIVLCINDIISQNRIQSELGRARSGDANRICPIWDSRSGPHTTFNNQENISQMIKNEWEQFNNSSKLFSSVTKSSFAGNHPHEALLDVTLVKWREKIKVYFKQIHFLRVLTFQNKARNQRSKFEFLEDKLFRTFYKENLFKCRMTCWK